MQEYSYEGGESSLELMPTSIGQENCRPGHSFGPGERNTYLIHYVLRGCGIFCVGGRKYHVGTGEAFIICPRELVYYEADAKTPWSYMWIGFSGFKAAECIGETILPERRVFRYSDEELCHCQQRMLEALQVDTGRELMMASVLVRVPVSPAASLRAFDAARECDPLRQPLCEENQGLYRLQLCRGDTNQRCSGVFASRPKLSLPPIQGGDRKISPGVSH